MNKNQLGTFKVILFVLGLAVIGAAFLIVNLPFPEDGIPGREKFFWINLAAMYLVFFCPLFFSSISTKNLDSKITPAIGIWISVFIFEIAALFLAVLVLASPFSMRAAAVIELVLFFVCAVLIYFGYFSGNHIANVQATEQNSLAGIAKVKNAFEILNLKSNLWNDDLDDQRTKVKQLCDDVKYLSPVDTEEAQKIEQQLTAQAAVLADSHFTPTELDERISEMELLIKQRKLMRK